MASNRERLIAKYGSVENYRAFMRSIAAKGGKVSVSKGFATNNLRNDPEFRMRRDIGWRLRQLGAVGVTVAVDAVCASVAFARVEKQYLIDCDTKDCQLDNLAEVSKIVRSLGSKADWVVEKRLAGFEVKDERV